jgi:hypothetical protein
MHVERLCRGRDLDKRQEPFEVNGVGEYRTPIVPPLKDVDADTRDGDSDWSRHGQRSEQKAIFLCRREIADFPCVLVQILPTSTRNSVQELPRPPS